MYHKQNRDTSKQVVFQYDYPHSNTIGKEIVGATSNNSQIGGGNKSGSHARGDKHQTD